MGRGIQLIGVWPESPASVKIKTAKTFSEESARFSVKICTSENFPLYDILSEIHHMAGTLEYLQTRLLYQLGKTR